MWEHVRLAVAAAVGLSLAIEINGGDGEAEFMFGGEQPCLEIGAAGEGTHFFYSLLLLEEDEYVAVNAEWWPR